MFYRVKSGLEWRRASVLCRRGLRRSCVFQVGLILLVWQAGELLARALGLPIPGAVLGMFLLLALLWNRRFSPAALRRGSRWFLAQMLLFLLPTVMSLADHREFFGGLGLKLLAVVCLGTLIVMVVTACLIDGCHRWLLARPVPANSGSGQ